MDVDSFHSFGTSIPYNQAKVIWPDTTGLHNMSTETTNSSTDKFTMIHETKSLIQKSIVSIDYIYIFKMVHIIANNLRCQKLYNSF